MAHRKILLKHRLELIRQMDVRHSDLWDQLLHQEVLTEDAYQSIQALGPERKQKGELLLYLSQRPEEMYMKFRTALLLSNQGYIVDSLLPDVTSTDANIQATSNETHQGSPQTRDADPNELVHLRMDSPTPVPNLEYWESKYDVIKREITEIGASELHKYIKKDYMENAKRLFNALSENMRKELVSFKVNGKPALFAAVEKGNKIFVDYLLNVCHADIDQKGECYVQEENVTVLATPLWSAVAEKKMNMVELLIKQGADINDGTDTLCTPLRVACYDSNQEMVKYLVQYGADINIPSVEGATCLMAAVYSEEICQYLIENGASVNVQSENGYTALHIAVHQNRQNTVELLLKQGGDPCIIDSFGDDCLQKAARKGCQDILDSLLQKVNCTKERKADLYELLGCSFVDRQNKPKAVELWKEAMKIRFSDPNKIIHKQPLEPNSAYLNLREARSMEDVEQLRRKGPDCINMECLMIRERILGKKDQDVISGIETRACLYSELCQFEKALNLFQYAFELNHRIHQPSKSSCIYDIRMLCHVLFQILNASKYNYVYTNCLRFSRIFSVLQVTVEEVKSYNTKAWLSNCKLQSSLLKSLLHLICLLQCYVNKTTEDKAALIGTVRMLVELETKATNRRPMIHFAVDENTSDETKFEPLFPSLRVTELLLKCGSSVNATDNYMNTPLHVLVEGCTDTPKTTMQMEKYEKLANYLISEGADLNAINSSGERAGQAVRRLFPKMKFAR